MYIEFIATCPHCGNGENLTITGAEQKDDHGISIVTCTRETGGCGKPFAVSAKVSFAHTVYKLQDVSTSEGSEESIKMRAYGQYLVERGIITPEQMHFGMLSWEHYNNTMNVKRAGDEGIEPGSAYDRQRRWFYQNFPRAGNRGSFGEFLKFCQHSCRRQGRGTVDLSKLTNDELSILLIDYIGAADIPDDSREDIRRQLAQDMEDHFAGDTIPF